MTTSSHNMNDNPHYVTPEEARRMDCAQTPSDRTCFGPRCMAWRWDEHAPMRYKVDGSREPVDQAKGYCGMVRS
jgi:hypothetical protein